MALDSLVMVLIVLIVFGPATRPELDSAVGQGIRVFRRTVWGEMSGQRTSGRCALLQRRSRAGYWLASRVFRSAPPRDCATRHGSGTGTTGIGSPRCACWSTASCHPAPLRYPSCAGWRVSSLCRGQWRSWPD